MSDFEHIHPEIAGRYRDMSDSDRISWLEEPRWFNYTRARQISQKLEWLYRHPRVARMPNTLLIGRTNNGKTDLITRFASQHRPSLNPHGENIIVPVLVIQTPPKPTESGLYLELLKPFLKRAPNGSSDAKRAFVVDVLRGVQLKVLVIDEMHNMLATSSQGQHLFLNVIKYLTNELQISIVGVGDQTLISAFSVDEQLQNRFEPEILPKWTEGDEVRRLLASYEMTLPLRKASRLSRTVTVNKLLAMSEGTIGELSKLLNSATRYAIETGVEQIDVKVLSKCGYKPPSERKWQVSEV
ncbi:TniB family NTP-binding protein [Pseudomonas nitroreducens]|uniref:TniB family NTP-binding protein n=1 Tax=Pseudomonas nitroreducens TaxID=46680 RepID=UPI001FE6DFC2|nr:TniB family NTP-binding protein [Pseudomonas nitritireducens]